MGIRKIVAVPPEYIRRLEAELTQPDDTAAAYMIYRVGRGFKLFRSKHAKAHGGYMVLDISGYRGGGPMSALVQEVIIECEASEFRGIVIDTGTAGASGQQVLSRTLAAAAQECGLIYFVPETLADTGKNSVVRVQTALSGGTLARHLTENVKRYGADRIAAEIERVRMDFILPARNGLGKALTDSELDALKTRYSVKTQYSPELAVKYFSYSDKKNAHFVLYDDEITIRRKLKLAEGLGVKYAFLFYPNVSDVLRDLII